MQDPIPSSRFPHANSIHRALLALGRRQQAAEGLQLSVLMHF